MKMQIADTKNALTYAFWSTINKIVLGIKFKRIEIRGLENLPRTGGFMLVSNHSSRWDGLLVYDLINKPANFLVHPNELRGFQGTVLKSMGAFPASTQFDLQTHIERQLRKGEAVVIFPEGDVYRDGQTHAFKSGAARFALNAVRQGVDLPVIPVAIKYADDMKSVCVTVGDAVDVKEYAPEFKHEATLTVRALTSRLYREICHMRLELGATKEAVNLFNTKPNRDFAHTA